MPYKTEKIRFDCPFFDKRSKLLPCQKEMIVYYSKRGYSQRKLAAMFNVSRRLITFIIDPQKLKKNYEARLELGGSKIYYKGGPEWAEAVRNHRRRKHSILKSTIKPT